MAAPSPHRKEQIPPRPRYAGADARERLLRAAYELFSQHGFSAVGVDRIIAEADVAKATLYRHFRSKNYLVVAVLARHEDLWTRAWLEPEAARRGESPEARLLAIFEALDDWFQRRDYQGCLFTSALVETHDRSSPIWAAAVAASENVYALVQRLAIEAGVHDATRFAHQIQLLMQGSIIAALQGRLDAAKQAGDAARQLLEQASRHTNAREGSEGGETAKHRPLTPLADHAASA